MDKGLTLPKIVPIIWPQIPKMSQKISAQFVCPSPKVSDFWKKLSPGVRSPCLTYNLVSSLGIELKNLVRHHPQLLIYLLGSMSGVKRNWIDGWLESASNTFNAKNSLDDWVKLIMKSFLQCFHEISCYYFPPLGYLNVCYIRPKHFRFVWFKPSLAHYVLLEHYYSMDFKRLWSFWGRWSKKKPP